eukprot:TRINITY_DN43683_c0_g1_i1.p1 TRINITY_DN43683_c0_g1~~TRINITY_DN43683_c0_g1_i1.p1  ORF type:complete len:444 (-),score=63.83 TRINITY_DN43683_c0_g1_i1:68-1399(-)
MEEALPSPAATDGKNLTTGHEGLAATLQSRLEGSGTDEVMNQSQRYEISKTVYTPMAATARNAKVHDGPTSRAPAAKTKGRTKWMREDKRHNPYSYFDSKNHATAPAEKKLPTPKLWFPETAEDVKIKKAAELKREQEVEDLGEGEDGGGDFGGAVGSDAKPKTKPKKFPEAPWDTEHHTMVSMANPEVQVFCREYFDKPMKREGEGIPKVRELYSMNDRQGGWCDEPAPLGELRRTYLDWVAPYNVGGPKCQQLPSYWRQNVRKSASAPSLNATFGGISKTPADQSFLERLAQMPASQSSEFWRGWLQHSTKTRPEKPGKDKSRRTKDRKHWLEKGGTKASGDASASAIKTDSMAELLGESTPTPKGGKRDWNDRWSVTHSKDNERMTKGHQQYFTKSQYLSGAEFGDPGSYLGLQSMKWRNVADHVSHHPAGRRRNPYDQA